MAAASPAEDLIHINFTIIHDNMVVIPVSINGAGLLNFLLDTGTSRTMVDSKVAAQLALPMVDAGVIVGIQGKATTSLVHCDSISIGGATVLDLDLTVLPRDARLPSGLSGILGEDFLENFDVLIDNRHHSIELQPGPGTLADELTGERLPIRLDGIMDGQPTIGRLIVACRAPELSRNEITLLLDSGINSLVLFGGSQSLGVGAAEQNYFVASATKGSSAVAVYTKMVRQLRVGRRILPNVLAVAPPAKPGTDTDGLLPTSLFSSIFISHSQKFVIFDPSTKH
jgi:hypothetical protein